MQLGALDAAATVDDGYIAESLWVRLDHGDRVGFEGRRQRIVAEPWVAVEHVALKDALLQVDEAHGGVFSADGDGLVCDKTKAAAAASVAAPRRRQG